jgi:ectoine hydroxylase-related dioxygenase (phytanoyl-CoA dioxygenase family)
LDDFTANNGATRVVPGSHLSRRKPQWSGGAMEGEITLTAPAGSVAIWLSNTWHRSGPNMTDQPRRAILSYYCRSWIKPFSDFPAGIPPTKARSFSPTLRYLLGYSARGPVRG